MEENEQRLCEACGKNETGRFWDGGIEGFGEKKAICGECLVSGKYRELLHKPVDEELTLIATPFFEIKTESIPEVIALDTEASVLPDGFEVEVNDEVAGELGLTEPKPHKHFYRKDGTCTCGRKRKAKK